MSDKPQQQLQKRNARAAIFALVLVSATLVAVAVWPIIRPLESFSLTDDTHSYNLGWARSAGTYLSTRESYYSPDKDSIYREARGNLVAFLIGKGFSEGSSPLYKDSPLRRLRPGAVVLTRRLLDGSLLTAYVSDTETKIDGRKGVGCIWAIGYEGRYWIWQMPHHTSETIYALKPVIQPLWEETLTWWNNYVAAHPEHFAPAQSP